MNDQSKVSAEWKLHTVYLPAVGLAAVAYSSLPFPVPKTFSWNRVVLSMMFAVQLQSFFLTVLPGLASGTLSGGATMYSLPLEREGQGRKCPVRKAASWDTSSLELCRYLVSGHPLEQGAKRLSLTLGVPTSHLCVISAGWPSEEGWREKPATGRIQGNGTFRHWRLCWGQPLVVLQFCECDCCLPGTRSPLRMAPWIINKLQ